MSKTSPLYVKRVIDNADEIISWAKGEGFKTTTKADDLHTTITYSKAPVVWDDMGPDLYSDAQGRITIAAGDGPRSVEPLGDKGAVVLKFQCSALLVRHNEMMRAGASWDYPGYQIHVTISYEAGDLDLDNVTPYMGRIVLGPEVFEEIVDSWQDTVEEAAKRLA